MKYIHRLFLLALISLIFIGWEQATAETPRKFSSGALTTAKAPVFQINIVNIFPHDPEAFTQGLAYDRGYLYESTGIQGKSVLKKMELKSGKVIKEVKLSAEYFGEGLTILDKKLYQLTWKNQTGFIYNLQDFKQIGKFFYQGEGWGLTTDGKILFLSDGSSVIFCIDPASFKIIRKIEVREGRTPVKNLNELEFVRGEIWANIFMEDVIARISPRNGKVLGWIDLSPLQSTLVKMVKRDVLNGIAYDAKGDRIFVTGKYWPDLYEINIQNNH